MNNFYRYPYYRNNNAPIPPPKPPPPPKKKKFCFKTFTKDTCTSLNEVEHFLCDFNYFLKYIKLYHLLK